MPVMISRSDKGPWRTSRWRPSSVDSSAYLLSKVATSASTACASSARAPSRNTAVSGSIKLPGWESWKTLVFVTAYHSFAGEVEALSTPTIRRLIPSCRHQLSPIAPSRPCLIGSQQPVFSSVLHPMTVDVGWLTNTNYGTDEAIASAPSHLNRVRDSYSQAK